VLLGWNLCRTRSFLQVGVFKMGRCSSWAVQVRVVKLGCSSQWVQIGALFEFLGFQFLME
jgi:hypothetical protein